MARILLIETATAVCSVALAECGLIVKEYFSTEGNDHAAKLTVFINEILKEQEITIKDVDAVAVSMGPGSYTGLRIGVSVAKGLCYAADKPLIAVSTLQSMASGMKERLTANETIDSSYAFCPMIDARRMEVYAAIFNSELETIREVKAEIIDIDSFKDVLANYTTYFFGSGAPKSSEFLASNSNSKIINDFVPSASHMIKIARQKYSAGLFEDVAYFEPFYLKDFIAGKPRVKGL